MAVGQTRRWRIGPLQLWIRRSVDGLEVAPLRQGEALDSVVEVEESAEMPADLPEDVLTHFSFDLDGDDIELVPRLADRPVVSRPAGKVVVPAREAVTIYISTPVWVELRAEGKALMEIATWRPSDTWLGTPMEGLLAYASRSSCRRRLDDVPVRPHRAITPVLLHNENDRPFLLERLNVPVTTLSLYAGPDHRLWTGEVDLTRFEDGGLGRIRLVRSPPSTTSDLQKVSDPREPSADSFVYRTFGTLFGWGR